MEKISNHYNAWDGRKIYQEKFYDDQLAKLNPKYKPTKIKFSRNLSKLSNIYSEINN